MMELQRQFREQGYVLVPDALPAAQLEPLRTAAARLTARCRSGEHMWVRRAPDREDTWGAGKLFQPTSFEPELIEGMASPRIREITTALLGPNRLAVVSFLYDPARLTWDGPWHRDTQYLIPHETERQRELVTLPTWSVQWNVALFEDDALEVVPGSLERWNTPEEQRILDGQTGPMPNTVTVRLRPGEGVVYTPMLIHRGRYRAEVPRATLHFACNQLGRADVNAPLQAPDVPPEALARLSEGVRRWLEVPGL